MQEERRGRDVAGCFLKRALTGCPDLLYNLTHPSCRNLQQNSFSIGGKIVSASGSICLLLGCREKRRKKLSAAFAEGEKPQKEDGQASPDSKRRRDSSKAVFMVEQEVHTGLPLKAFSLGVHRASAACSLCCPFLPYPLCFASVCNVVARIALVANRGLVWSH